MTHKRLRDIFSRLDDPEESVLLGSVLHVEDAALAPWRRACADAAAAYEDWRRERDADSYAAYRACADRADAAQDALAARARSCA